jgi:hypothetical protein
MPPKTYIWSDIHAQRYNTLYNYLKNTLKLDIEKENYLEKINPRDLEKYIRDNDKWQESTKENYYFTIARKYSILKKKRHATNFSQLGFDLKTKREENEGKGGLDIKEQENWRPHEYFVSVLGSYQQDTSIPIIHHLKILLLTLLTYQPPLRTSFFTSALFLQSLSDNDKKHNYVYINRRGSSKVQYIVNKDKASNYKIYNMHKNLSFIDVEGEAKQALLFSYQNFPRHYLFEINGEPITDATLLRWLREISGVPHINIDIMRSSYITWFYERNPSFNQREKLGHLMRHSQKTAQLNYNKVFTTEFIEEDLKKTKQKLVERDIQIRELQNRLDAFEKNKPDKQVFNKRRRDIIYQLNTKNRNAKQSTIEKYNIIFNSSSQKYE